MRPLGISINRSTLSDAGQHPGIQHASCKDDFPVPRYDVEARERRRINFPHPFVEALASVGRTNFEVDLSSRGPCFLQIMNLGKILIYMCKYTAIWVRSDSPDMYLDGVQRKYSLSRIQSTRVLEPASHCFSSSMQPRTLHFVAEVESLPHGGVDPPLNQRSFGGIITIQSSASCCPLVLIAEWIWSDHLNRQIGVFAVDTETDHTDSVPWLAGIIVVVTSSVIVSWFARGIAVACAVLFRIVVDISLPIEF
jgi:hypothetical protein